MQKPAKISPKFKSKKQWKFCDSYRPINNLKSLDKLIQQYIKQELQTHQDLNNIVLEQHHRKQKKITPQ